MNHFSPYNIYHLHFDNIQEWPRFISKTGYYVVLWWKQIPMGDFFINTEFDFTNENVTIEIIKAIKSTIIKEFDTTNEEWQNWLLQNDIQKFKHWLSNLYKNKEILEFPSTVPVTVIICTRDRPSYLARCLESIKSMKTQPQEIIVVDNGPGTESTRNVVERFNNIIYLPEHKPGLSYARNTGIVNANMPVIAFTDDDVIVHPHWIYRTWFSFEENEIAALTGPVIASEIETKTQYLFEKYWTLNHGFTTEIYDKEYFQKHLSSGPPVWYIGAGANSSFRKEVFDDVGFFDERLGAGAAGCSEDSEIWFRILKQDYRIMYKPEVVVFHEHRKNEPALYKQVFSYMKGHAAAALIQQQSLPQAKYKSYVYTSLFKKSFTLLKRILLRKNLDSEILQLEVKGLISGIIYYHNNKKFKGNRSNA